MYTNVMGRGYGSWCRVFCHRTRSLIFLILLQTQCREQGSLFLVIFAMHSKYCDGKGGGGYVSFRLIAEIKDHCF